MKIALYLGSDFVDKTILFFSRGGYTHAAIILPDDTVIEAYPFRGIRKRKNLTDQMGDAKVEIYEVVTTPEQDAIIVDFLNKQIGKGYDYWNIFGFVLHTTHEGRTSQGKWFCSELVFAAFQEAGINLLARVEAWMVSPTILSFNTIMRTHERFLFKRSIGAKIAM